MEGSMGEQGDVGSDDKVLRVVLRATDVLAAAFDFKDGLRELARLLVEDVSDICLIDVLEGDEIVRVAALHRDEQAQALVDELRERYPPVPGGPHPVATAIATRGVQWRRDMPVEFLRDTTQDARHLELVETLRFSSYVTVPIVARGEVMGAVTTVRIGSRAPFDDGEVALLADLARRAAVHLHNARLYEEREIALNRLRRFQEVTDLALAALPIDDFIDEVMLRLQRAVQADTARVLLVTEDARSLHGGGSIGLGDGAGWKDEVPIGFGFAGHIAESRKMLVVFPPSSDFEFASPALGDLAVIAGVPLLVGETLIGVLHVGRRALPAFEDEDLTLLQLAAERIAVAIHESQQFERERQKTLALQSSLLPSALTPIPGCEAAAGYWPADHTMAVGGDFYDIFEIDEQRVGLLIGDVAGKGVVAAAFTGLARHTVRTGARHTQRVDEPLLWLHQAMTEHAEDYCTALFGWFIRERDHVRFEFATGGHPLPVLLRAGRAVTLGSPGVPLGLIDEPKLSRSEVALERGDILVFYTDGITDTRDRPLDDDALHELLLAVANPDPEKMGDAFMTRLRELRATQEDDIALLLVVAHDVT